MKILFTDRFFWPDAAPYATILRTIAEAAAADGHDVHVFCSRPSYRTTSHADADAPEGLEVRRCFVFQESGASIPVRLLNLALYCIALFVHIVRVRPDVVTAGTFPPIMAAWVASLASKIVGAKFVYHLQDIYPEVMSVSDWAIGRGIAEKFFRWLDNGTLKRSSVLVTLSEDMAKTLRRRNLGDLPIQVINNFAMEGFGAEMALPPAELRKSAGRRRLIFAGNLGRFQGLPLLVEGIAISLEKHPELEVLFLGDGKAAQGLKERWKGHSQVIFGPFLPFPQARELIVTADVGLVSLHPRLHTVAYPSKILTYISLGLPVLAVVERDSALARTVFEERLGTVPVDRTPEAVSDALELILSNRIEPEEMRAWYEKSFGADNLKSKWRDLFASLQ